ncbi:MAG TPA: hypothetical protein VK934_13600, partial [Fimbriimonas sp.]|nr:hypothetical protein [Fimbriimonas sp.]
MGQRNRKSFVAWLATLSDKRSQHLVFLVHVWLFAPFLIMWLRDSRIQTVLGANAVSQLQPTILAVVLYLGIRTWLAWKDPPRLKWELVFPPIDVFVVTLILCISHRGPMSNISLLFFLPLIEAAGTLRVRWSALVALMVVTGTIISAMYGLGASHQISSATLQELWN